MGFEPTTPTLATCPSAIRYDIRSFAAIVKNTIKQIFRSFALRRSSPPRRHDLISDASIQLPEALKLKKWKQISYKRLE